MTKAWLENMIAELSKLRDNSVRHKEFYTDRITTYQMILINEWK